jgi:hypothetical protein
VRNNNSNNIIEKIEESKHYRGREERGVWFGRSISCCVGLERQTLSLSLLVLCFSLLFCLFELHLSQSQLFFSLPFCPFCYYAYYNFILHFWFLPLHFSKFFGFFYYEKKKWIFWSHKKYLKGLWAMWILDTEPKNMRDIWGNRIR